MGLVTISVVIPLFNKQDTIGRAVSSVRKQSRLPEQLIIVDDGSTDASAVAAQRALNSPGRPIRSQLISVENAGVSAARNRGADESDSDYIAFLDADDEWLPGYLEEVERLATTFPSAGVLTIRSAKLNPDGDLVPEASPLPERYFGLLDRPLNVYRRGYGIIHTSGIAIKRAAWRRSGGFPVGARKSQDVYLWLRLAMTETIAHSGSPLSIWHDDCPGHTRRKGVVPHHFCYYLTTDEGRSYLNASDLVNFLGSNLVVQIAAHRVTDDWFVAAELRRVSAALPVRFKVLAWIASLVPLPALRALIWWRRRSRGLKR